MSDQNDEMNLELSDDSSDDMPENPLALSMNDKPRDIVKEMEESYLDYAMSVIVSRALQMCVMV